VCVLPYAHGTHSGWLELCWDLGVPVAAPAVGHYGDQHRDGSVATFGDDDLPDALRALAAAPTSTRAGTPERAAQVRERRADRDRTDAVVRAAHAGLYRRLLAERVR
jgi:hypothetical protein